VLIDTHKVKAARKVLAALQKILRNVPKGANYILLEHYQNCREQGFLVVNYKTSSSGTSSHWVAFSECRNSDSIVVFPSSGETDYPPMQGISEKSWENRVFFKPDEYDKAAAFCKKHLLD
jgi:hypothetical protein